MKMAEKSINIATQFTASLNDIVLKEEEISSSRCGYA